MRIRPGRRGAPLALALALPLILPTPVRASALEGLAGWEGDSRQEGYGFVGVGVHSPPWHHVSASVGASASYLYYRYDSTNANITVGSPGASLMGGIRVGAPRGSVSLMAGSELRWEHRAIDVLGVASDRTTHGLVLQTYDDLALSRRWLATAFGVYVGAAQYMIGRMALRYQITNLDWRKPTTFYLGLEGVRQGNDVSDALQAGGFAEWNIVPQQLSLGLHSGYKETWSPGQNHQPGTYFGIGLYRRL